MNNDSPLYAHLKRRAQQAERHAQNGRCFVRWQNAACLWDKAMPHSRESSFVKRLHEESFMGSFQYWRTHRGRGVIKNDISSNGSKTAS